MRLILQGKMTTLKNGKRRPLNIIFLKFFFSEASLNIKRNILKGGAFFVLTSYPLLNRAIDSTQHCIASIKKIIPENVASYLLFLTRVCTYIYDDYRPVNSIVFRGWTSPLSIQAPLDIGCRGTNLENNHEKTSFI